MNNRRGARAAVQPMPLVSEQAERAIIGIALSNSAVFWDIFGKLRPQHFATPRLSRIWDAMCRLGDSNKPISRNYVSVMIRNDSEETTPLALFLAAIVNDAPAASEADAYCDTVLHLAHKRSLIEALDRAKSEIMAIDIGTPVEHMVDAGVKLLTHSIDADNDDDMRTFDQWGAAVYKEAAEAYERKLDEESGGVGLPCGLAAVEDVIGRLLPGKLYVLAGMSSSGKSALARQIAQAAMEEATRRKMGAAYIASLEMTGQEYATRAIAEALGIPSNQIEQGNVSGNDIERIEAAARRLSRFNTIIDSRPRMTMKDIRTRMLKAKIRFGGLALGVIDHLVIVNGEKGEGLFDKVSSVTIESKNLAKELGIPIILLAQLNEKKILESGSGWPNASHLFGGETIVQNADVIAFVHRPEIVLAKKEPSKDNIDAHDKWVARMDNSRGKAHFFNDKRRGGERRVTREMTFDGPLMTFRDQ